VRADASGLQFVNPRLIEHRSASSTACCCAASSAAIPLFGPACELIRAEALIRLTRASRAAERRARARPARRPALRDPHGSELLIFLGRVLTRCMGRWLIP
jgi:hypothetical protein